MNRREFLEKGLKGIIASIPLISSCTEHKNPIKSEPEIYIFKMIWYNANATTRIYLDSPEEKFIREYSGYYPDVGEPIILGQFNSIDKLIFKHESYGKSFSNPTPRWCPMVYSTDPKAYKIEELSDTHWLFTFDDGFFIVGIAEYFKEYDDGSFEVYKMKRFFSEKHKRRIYR